MTVYSQSPLYQLPFVHRLSRRRQFVFDYLWQHFGFATTRFLRSTILPYAAGISVGKNVRSQSLRNLRLEFPDASIVIGDNTILYERARLEAFEKGKIAVGASCILGDVRICSRSQIVLGKRVITSWNVFLQDFDPHPVEPDERRAQVTGLTERFVPRYDISTPEATNDVCQGSFSASPISIGDDVWLGANVTILKGVTIGSGSVVGAGAVVTAGSFPERSVIAGNPARVVKEIPVSSERSEEVSL